MLCGPPTPHTCTASVAGAVVLLPTRRPFRWLRKDKKMTGIDLLHVAELYVLIFFSILIVTLALMFGATLLFWTHYPDGLDLSKS
jgi:hypothetical protein